MDPLEELARVYADAEHALAEIVAREVAREVARDGDGPTENQARLAAVRAVRVAAQDAVRGLNGRVPPLARQVLTDATERGSTAASVSLARLLGAPTDGEVFDRRKLDRLAASVNDRVTEAHNAILRTAPDAYRQVIQRAAPGLLVGAQTRREAAQRAMAEFARRGVTGFTDRAGRNWELASYVEMTLRTAAARAETDAQVERFQQAGHELVMSSDAPQECAWCRPFEGRVLALTGPPGKRKVPHATRRGRTVTVDVVDTLNGARLRGYQHPNCRHTVVLYLPGVTKAPTGPGTGPDPEGEAARDRQRAIEREIRHYKRRVDLSVDEAGRKRAKQLVRAWQGRMREHLAEHPDLRRLPYREAPGIGNTPTPEMLADPAGPFRGRLDDKRPNQLTDDELEEAMANAVVAEDLDLFAVLGDESDRREEAQQRREVRNARARERRAAQAEQRDAERWARMEALLNAGADDEEATERVYGTTVEKQRRDAARARLIGEGYGYLGSFDKMARKAYRDELDQEMLRAQNANSALVKRIAPDRVSTVSLWKRNEAYARRWASEELLLWWDQNGRLTYDLFVDGLLNGRRGGTYRGGDFLQ